MKHGISMAKRWYAVALATAGMCCTASAQDALRDPTAAPAGASAAPDTPARSPVALEGMSVIVRDGKAGLVVGTRIVQPGQKIGSRVLERITETEIWLREGKSLHKVPRFSGIERHDTAKSSKCAIPMAAARVESYSGKTAKRTPMSLTSPASNQADTQCDVPPTRSSNP